MAEQLLSKATAEYVSQLIENNNKPKALLLDESTTVILSLAATQSTLLRKDVFLIDKIENVNRQKMRHLECIVFVRPCSESIQNIVSELRDPKYSQYTLVFTNILRKSYLERLAEADDFECIVKVQEMFLDFCKINRDLFHCNVPLIHGNSLTSWDTEALDKCSESLFSAIASMDMGVPSIRFDANSKLSKNFAQHMSQLLNSNSGILPKSTNQPDKNLVLVLDRFNDPITPLISHWTYQAMVEELIGIVNNRVDLHYAPDVPQSHKEIVLSQDQDQFFNEHQYFNFGDLGAAVREYVQHYSKHSSYSQKLDTVQDIKKFVGMLPEFKKLQENTTKHVSLVGELSRLVSEENLLSISELEQSLACNENHAQDLQSIRDLLANDSVPVATKYRLVALYGIRYRNHPSSATQELLQALSIQYNQPEIESSVRALLNVYSSKYPQEDLFNQGSIFTRAQQGLKGLRGVENVYTQHKPLLELQLSLVTKNRLQIDKYPIIGNKVFDPEHSYDKIIVFMIGGATFEEARIVNELNKIQPCKIVLGGSNMVSTRTFLKNLES